MRAIVEHGDWLVPAALWMQGYGAASLKQLVMFGQEMAFPPGEVWIFSEMEAGLSAQQQGARLGPYEGGVLGARFFARFQPGWGIVRINPGSPPEQTLTLDAQWLHHAAIWAGAIGLETGFRAVPPPGDPKLFEFMRHFQDYLIAIHVPSQEPVYYTSRPYKRAMVACTAPDNLAKFMDFACSRNREEFRTMSLDGERLFRLLVEQRMDAVCFNPYGPGPRWECGAQIAQRVLAAR